MHSDVPRRDSIEADRSQHDIMVNSTAQPQTTVAISAQDSTTAVCGHCNITACPKVTEPCGEDGERKDTCGCCPRCLVAGREGAKCNKGGCINLVILDFFIFVIFLQ